MVTRLQLVGQWGQSHGLGSLMQPRIPCRHHNGSRREHKRARDVDGIEAAERMLFGEVARIVLELRRHLDGSQRAMKLGPVGLGLPMCPRIKTTTPLRGRKRGTDLGMSDTTGQHGVHPIPDQRSIVAPVLLDDELRQCAGSK